MDTTLSPVVGQLLDGRYQVQSRLAQGGMATVYLGRDLRLDRVVALKIAHPELASDDEFIRRFITEARAVAQLSSSNVVAIFDQGSVGDVNYIAMEYVAGPTLREVLRARGALSVRESLDVIEGVLAGLAAAHRAGIIHRDVKPENVLLGAGGVVKVADFGLARASTAADRTNTGMIIGTAAYLAPEQVSASSSDARTDVYAAGVMLFEMLTGSQPHTGESPLAVAHKHVSDIVRPPSTLVAGLPPALDALVALATSRDPELRPADAGQFLHAVTEVRHGAPLSAARRGQHAAPSDAPAGPGAATGREAWPAAGLAAGALAGSALGNSAPASSATGNGGPAAGGPAAGNGGPAAGGLAGGNSGNGELVARAGTAGGAGGTGAGGRHGAGSLDDTDLRPVAAGLAGYDLDRGPGSPQARPAGDLLPQQYAPGQDLPWQYAPGQAPDGVNHTLVVSAGTIVPGFGDAGEDRPGRRRARYGPEHEPPLQRLLFSRRLIYVLISVAVVLLAVLLAWWLTAGQYTKVPQVTGWSASLARSELSGLGFKVTDGTPEHSSLAPGHIISTSPRAGAKARTGSTITFTLSLGPAKVGVPAVTGMQLAQAEQALRAKGLTWRSPAQATSATIAAGVVLSTDPVAGTAWPKDKPVGITVSAGPPLPTFVGGQLSAAQAAAAAGGYQIQPMTDAKSSQPSGTVTRQSPVAGSPIHSGEVVTVYVSAGPPQVSVPDVDGMQVRQAVAALQAAGFKVSVNQGFGNRVSGYSPTGQAPSGTTVTINVGFTF